LEVVKFLVESGADVHANKDEALKTAVRYRHLEAIRYLVEKGADIHVDDDWPLRWAVDNGHLEVIRCLVENGADVRKVNIEELVYESKEVLYLLLDRLSKEELMPLLVSSNNRLRKAVKAYLRRKVRWTL